MRVQRLLVTLIAACLLGLVPVATATASHASEPTAETVAATAETAKQAGPATAQRTRRWIRFNFDATSRRTFRFFGKIQDGANKRVILVRSNTRNGKYRHFRQARTNRFSQYNIKRLSRTGFYALKVPGGNKYLTSYSKVIRVYYA